MENNAHAGSFAYNLDFTNMNMFGEADYSKPSEGNTQMDFPLYEDNDVALDLLAASFGQSFGSMNTPLFPAEDGFAMPQNFAMDNTLMNGSTAWNAPTDFAAPAHMMQQASLAPYQPLNSNMKRPLQLDTTQDYPRSKRHESVQFGSNFNSPFMTDDSLTTPSSWAMDAQLIPTPSPDAAEAGLEMGLSDQEADFCMNWFNMNKTCPTDQDIASLSQLTKRSVSAIRSWFGEMLKQGIPNDSGYNSQTKQSQSDPGLTNATTVSQGEVTVSPSNNEATVSTPLRGGKKRCTPTDNPDLLARDREGIKIYQCTRKCGKRYRRKCDWKRNEEEGYACTFWICSLCSSQGVEKVRPCTRRYHFVQHFKNIHDGVDPAQYEETSKKHADTTFPKRCGFCPHRFSSRQERIDHIAAHFEKDRKCMLDWKDEDEDNHDGDDGDDGDDDSDGNGPDSFHDKDYSGPSNRRIRPANSRGGKKDVGSERGGQSGSSGGFSQFQLSGSQQPSTCSESSSQDSSRGSLQDFLQTTIQPSIGEQNASSKDQVLPDPSPQHVPGGVSRHTETKGDDAHAVARDGISMTETTLHQRKAGVNQRDLGTLMGLLYAMTEAQSSIADSRRRQTTRKTPTADFTHKGRQSQDQDQDLVGPVSKSIPSGGEGGSSEHYRSEPGDEEQQGVLTLWRNKTPSEDRPKSIPDIFCAADDLKPLLNMLATMADQTTLHAKYLETLPRTCMLHDNPILTGGDRLLENSRLWKDLRSQSYYVSIRERLEPLLGLDRQLDHHTLIQPSTILQNWTGMLQRLPGTSPSAIDLDPAVVASTPYTAVWKEITNRTEHEIFKSPSFLSLKLLGSGGFSTVDEVVDKETNLRLSRKTLKNRQQSAIDELKKEVEVLQKLRHPHIVRFLGAYYNGDKASILLLPVADMSLAGWLDRCYAERPVGLAKTILQMFGCLASSVRYLHEQRPVIKHMDIKPQNILITLGDNDVPHVILSDFGISSLEQNRSDDEKSRPVTRRYCAPEVIFGTARDPAADIWSLGCVFFEMLAAGYVLRGQSKWHEFRKEFMDRKGKFYWQHVSHLHQWLEGFLDEAVTPTETATLRTVKSMLNSEPTERPTAAMVATIFTPASCCLSLPNQEAIYPGPTEELQTLESLLRQHGNESARDPLHKFGLSTRSQHEQDGEDAQVAFSRAKAWLSECAHNHEICFGHVNTLRQNRRARGTNPHRTIAAYTPARLIDIRPSDSTDGTFIRLVLSDELPPDLTQEEYVAVSHTWVDTDLTLSQTRLQNWQDRLDKCLLSEELLSAVDAADRIGTRYIWVDSLCVLQDSLDDKKRECINMASTFRNAFLTMIVQRTDADGQLAATTATSESRAFAWDTRDWALQDRLLSSRILHLTREQMYWECNSLKASETFPHGLPNLIWEKVHTKSAGSRRKPYLQGKNARRISDSPRHALKQPSSVAQEAGCSASIFRSPDGSFHKHLKREPSLPLPLLHAGPDNHQDAEERGRAPLSSPPDLPSRKRPRQSHRFGKTCQCKTRSFPHCVNALKEKAEDNLKATHPSRSDNGALAHGSPFTDRQPGEAQKDIIPTALGKDSPDAEMGG